MVYVLAAEELAVGPLEVTEKMVSVAAAATEHGATATRHATTNMATRRQFLINPIPTKSVSAPDS